MSHRFFVPPDAVCGREVHFDRAPAHQMRSVLRLRPGDEVIVLDGTGVEYTVDLVALERDAAQGRVRARRVAQTEPRLALTLYQGLLKADRFEWVLQKGTELGVSTFVPLLSRRTVARPGESIENKRTRWARIISEAAEQSHRARLPHLADPLDWAAACAAAARAHDLFLLPWEGASGPGLCALLHALPAPPARPGLLIGPEGGLEAAEVDLARAHGAQVVTLGPRILRAETAGLAAVAIILSELGEMGGS